MCFDNLENYNLKACHHRNRPTLICYDHVMNNTPPVDLDMRVSFVDHVSYKLPPIGPIMKEIFLEG